MVVRKNAGSLLTCYVTKYGVIFNMVFKEKSNATFHIYFTLAEVTCFKWFFCLVSG